MFPSPYLDTPWMKMHPLLSEIAKRLSELGCDCVRTPLFPSWRWLMANRRKIDIVHIHWPELYYARPEDHGLLWRLGAGPLSAFWVHGFIRFWRLHWLYGFFALAKWLGIPVVWTMHDLYSHGYTPANRPRAEHVARRFLMRHANAVIVNGASAEAPAVAECGRPRRLFVAPLGNYRGWYPDTLSDAEARNDMGIGPDEKVFLCFGTMRPRRNPLKLIEHFRSLPQQNLKLLVSGEAPEALRRDVERAALGDWRIRCYFQTMPNEYMERYFKSADWVVMPGEHYLTSGISQVALSYGRPVIAERYGATADAVGDAGILYDPDDADGLGAAIRRAAAEDLAPWKARAAERAKAFSWTLTAERTLEAYRTTLAGIGAGGLDKHEPV
jgi:glycosyltransferase involved in cell wall biosynthesis